jgi:heme A synthase
MDYNSQLQDLPFAVIIALVALALWSAIWKALGLWRAARRGSVGWFIVFFIVNTAGILEIIYLIATSKRRSA